MPPPKPPPKPRAPARPRPAGAAPPRFSFFRGEAARRLASTVPSFVGRALLERAEAEGKKGSMGAKMARAEEARKAHAWAAEQTQKGVPFDPFKTTRAALVADSLAYPYRPRPAAAEAGRQQQPPPQQPQQAKGPADQADQAGGGGGADATPLLAGPTAGAEAGAEGMPTPPTPTPPPSARRRRAAAAADLARTPGQRLADEREAEKRRRTREAARLMAARVARAEAEAAERRRAERERRVARGVARSLLANAVDRAVRWHQQQEEEEAAGEEEAGEEAAGEGDGQQPEVGSPPRYWDPDSGRWRAVSAATPPQPPPPPPTLPPAAAQTAANDEEETAFALARAAISRAIASAPDAFDATAREASAALVQTVIQTVIHRVLASQAAAEGAAAVAVGMPSPSAASGSAHEVVTSESLSFDLTAARKASAALVQAAIETAIRRAVTSARTEREPLIGEADRRRGELA